MSFLLLPPFAGKPLGGDPDNERREARRFRWTVRYRRVVLFLRQTWPNLLWSEFVALLAGITFRSPGVWVWASMAVLAFHWRLWREVSKWRSRAEANERRADKAERGYSSALAMVENQVRRDTHSGPGYWIDETYYPIVNED